VTSIFVSAVERLTLAWRMSHFPVATRHS
jgi:hypothetical protein